MGGFISKQPNGKYCRFSSIVDCLTHINMTFEDYVKVIEERGKTHGEAVKEAKDVIDNYIQPFERVKEDFEPANMTRKEFKKVLKMCEDPNGEYFEP